MIKVYAVTLAIGVLALLVVILGTALAEASGGKALNVVVRWGSRGRVVLGGLLGFGMGGLAAEYSPIDMTWPIALLIAVGGLTLGVVWVRYAAPSSDN